MRKNPLQQAQRDFQVSDKVVHPYHGAGIIRNVESRSIDGKRLNCFIIELCSDGGYVLVPINSSDNLGLRKVVGGGCVSKIMNALRKKKGSLPKEIKDRQSFLKEKIYSGDPIMLALAIRAMYERNLTFSLSFTERKLYRKAKEMLASEIALSSNTGIDDAYKRIGKILKADEYNNRV